MNNFGFCSVTVSSKIYKLSSMINTFQATICLFIVVFCFFFVTVFLRNSIVDRNMDSVREGFAKLLLYLSLINLLPFLDETLAAVNPSIQAAHLDKSTARLIAIKYILQLIFSVPLVATPIVAIIFLKPLRMALKQIVRMALCASDQDEVEDEMNPASERLREAFEMNTLSPVGVVYQIGVM